MIQDILLSLVLAAVCATIAYLLRANKQRILALTTSLIREAEQAIQGTGMGAAKKAKVIAQLEAAGIGVTAWLDKAIDAIVAQLNSKQAWLLQEAQDGAQDPEA